MKYILILLLIISPVTALEITEVFPNPEGIDNNKEFIEIYGTDNLTGYIVGDSKENDTLELIKYYQGNFSLIVEEGFNQDINASLYSTGKTIGNNLDNDEDTMYVTKGNTTITVSYTNAEEGKSYQKINNKWVYDTPSPGYLRTEEEKCNITIQIQTNKDIYTNKETIEFSHKITPETTNYTIIYTITDLFNNTYKEETTTENTNKKQYTPDINEKEKTLIIKSTLKACQTTTATKTITIQGEEIKETNIEIKKIYGEDSITFGKETKVKINIDKGETQEDKIIVTVEDYNKNIIVTPIEIRVPQEKTHYEITLPLQMPNSCEYTNNTYLLKVNGLNKEVAKEIKITKNPQCQSETITEKQIIQNNKTQEENTIIMQPKSLKKNQEQPRKENMWMLPSIFSGILLIISIYYITKNENPSNNSSGGISTRTRQENYRRRTRKTHKRRRNEDPQI